jgi:hypothetical protein
MPTIRFARIDADTTEHVSDHPLTDEAYARVNGWLLSAYGINPEGAPRTLAEAADAAFHGFFRGMLDQSNRWAKDQAAQEAAAATPEELPLWRVGIPVQSGQRYVYNSAVYIVQQAHTTQADWTPDVATTLWSPELAGPENQWQAGVAYATNDVVSYNGTEYRCITGHTSQVGWEPPNVPALWEPVV